MYYVDQRNILTEGRIEPNVTITVTKKNGDIATIFSDDSGTNLENPFVTGEDGLSKFYVNKTGQYNITATKGRATQTFNDVYIGDIKYMPNLLSNHGFEIPAPGVVLDATPRDFAAGEPLRDGWITAEACTGVTYIDGAISRLTGSYYQDVPRAGTDLQYITDFTASIKSANGTPSTTGVSWSIVGDYFRVTVSASNVFSVCFNEGDFAANGVAFDHLTKLPQVVDAEKLNGLKSSVNAVPETIVSRDDNARIKTRGYFSSQNTSLDITGGLLFRRSGGDGLLEICDDLDAIRSYLRVGSDTSEFVLNDNNPCSVNQVYEVDISTAFGPEWVDKELVIILKFFNPQTNRWQELHCGNSTNDYYGANASNDGVIIGVVTRRVAVVGAAPYTGNYGITQPLFSARLKIVAIKHN